MVHTPAEELFNKEFGTVRFTEGYDMDEVDDYLDNELIPCMKELMAENSQLKKELEEARVRISELESGASPVAAETNDEAVVDDEPTVVTPVSEAATGETPVVAVVDEADEAEAPVAPEETPAAAVSASPSTSASPAAADQSAAGIIALAQRLHDEHVQKGEAEYSRLIGEAEEKSRQIVGEAEEKSRSTLKALESEKVGLEKTIEQLRTFERDYRNRLRTYLENQMRELETSGTQEQHANFGL